MNKFRYKGGFQRKIGSDNQGYLAIDSGGNVSE